MLACRREAGWHVDGQVQLLLQLQQRDVVVLLRRLVVLVDDHRLDLKVFPWRKNACKTNSMQPGLSPLESGVKLIVVREDVGALRCADGVLADHHRHRVGEDDLLEEVNVAI